MAQQTENNNMTAVQWLKTEIEKYGDPHCLAISWKDLDDLIKEAKQMEKEQISKGYMSGLIDGMNQKPKEYYNETYGK